jgi:hypothetical protein
MIIMKGIFLLFDFREGCQNSSKFDIFYFKNIYKIKKRRTKL